MTSSLRLLLWLKWTLTWRGYRRSRSKVVGAFFFLLIFLPLSGFCAYGIWVLLREETILAQAVCRDTLTIIYLLWATTPLLGFPLNESFDLTRLFVYPISYTRLFLGAIVGSLFDRSVLLALPVLIVLLLLLSPAPVTFVIILVLLTLFLLHTLALGQALMLLLIGFLRSRRFRDITVVLFPLIGMAYYLGQRLLMRRMAEGTLSISAIVQAPAWRFALWLPPGWAAWGVEAARHGQYGAVLAAIIGLAAATAATTGVAVMALRTLYTGDVGPRESRAEPAAVAPAATELPALRGMPAEVAAVVWKEWTYFRRDPQYKALAVQSAYTLVVVGVSVALPSVGRSLWGVAPGDLLLLGISGVLLLSLLPLLFNIWAGEGAAITALFSLPTPRRALLLGKNIAHGALLLGVCAIGLLVTSALSHRWSALPLAAVWVLLAAPLLLATGNLVSIRFPHRMLVRGQRWGRGGLASADEGTGSGCAYSLLYLLAYGATFAVLLPALAAVLLPGHFGIAPLWHALSLPLAALYSLALYLILLRQAEVWLLARETAIIARIVPE